MSSAVQTAAARQTGLSQLFANLAAATGAQSLPPQVQQAVVQLFALQPELSDNLTGAKIQAAFEAYRDAVKTRQFPAEEHCF